MQNEQCGICWDLKYDKQGKSTHGVLHPHDFSPIDFCAKCKEPKFDHQGFLTHRSEFDLNTSTSKHHVFVSSTNAINNSQKRKKLVFALGGIASTIATANTNLMNLFY
ncbi:MAG: hypothetical protein ACO2Y5_06140 [Nitrosopumilaceae archaeon]|uniref:Uncharacterized protein n=1 Tax=Candidatus Nitrosomaritimum aestuariumsis TaxID=3342354 RepID=A0AC60W2X6_9ARCH|nr:hypothetical protein [Nitrosopumilaceae archaeon]